MTKEELLQELYSELWALHHHIDCMKKNVDELEKKIQRLEKLEL